MRAGNETVVHERSIKPENNLERNLVSIKIHVYTSRFSRRHSRALTGLAYFERSLSIYR